MQNYNNNIMVVLFFWVGFVRVCVGGGDVLLFETIVVSHCKFYFIYKEILGWSFSLSGVYCLLLETWSGTVPRSMDISEKVISSCWTDSSQTLLDTCRKLVSCLHITLINLCSEKNKKNENNCCKKPTKLIVIEGHEVFYWKRTWEDRVVISILCILWNLILI